MTVEHHQRTGLAEILTIRQGLVAGLAAALAMAAVAMFGSNLLGAGTWTPINAAGSFFIGEDAAPVPTDLAGAVTLLGIVVTLVTGGLLGMLYASAQSPEDTPSLIVIGVFYGLVIYIVSRLLLRWLDEAVFDVWRTWPVFAGHLVFGATLACVAAWRSPLRRRSAQGR